MAGSCPVNLAVAVAAAGGIGAMGALMSSPNARPERLHLNVRPSANLCGRRHLAPGRDNGIAKPAFKGIDSR